MIIKIKIWVVASSIMILGFWAIGYAGSEVPKVLTYELWFNKSTYAGHSVTFAHATHAMNYKIACIRCHHMLEQGATAVEETCQDCHTNTEMRSFPKAESIPAESRMDYFSWPFRIFV